MLTYQSCSSTFVACRVTFDNLLTVIGLPGETLKKIIAHGDDDGKYDENDDDDQ